MASSYTTSLRLDKQGTGDNSNTWGVVLDGDLDLIDAAISGQAAVAMPDANYSLTTVNGGTDEARRAQIKLAGSLTAARELYVPAVCKFYIVENNTGQDVSVYVTAKPGTGVAVKTGTKRFLWVDATNVVDAFTDVGLCNFRGAVTITGALTVTGNVAVTGNVTATGSVSGAASQQTLADAATIAWNAANGVLATVTLGGNRTMGLPTNLQVGTLILIVKQDGTGSRTLAWNAAFKWPGGVAPVLSTTAAAVDIFSFVYDGTSLFGTYLRGLA